MSESCAWSNDTNWETTAQVTEADDKANSEYIVTSELSILPINDASPVVCDDVTKFVLENDGDNNSVNSDCFAKDDWDKVFGYDMFHLNSRAHNTDTSRKDAPIC